MSPDEERLKPPSAAKYFFALTGANKCIHSEVELSLAREFGPLGDRSEIYSFSAFTSYYDEELGGATWKYLIALDQLRPVDGIVDAKLITEELEGRFAQHVAGKRQRTINIDPGYLTGWQVVLASVKNHGHRLYMGNGVYCELTLLYQHREFHALPWTYTDYTSAPVLSFFRLLRGQYCKQLKKPRRRVPDSA
jgi:hypothetical protein